MSFHRLCCICGARVTNENPKTTTCSPFCTDAKRKGLSYSEAHEQAARETIQDEGARDNYYSFRGWAHHIDYGHGKKRLEHE